MFWPYVMNSESVFCDTEQEEVASWSSEIMSDTSFSHLYHSSYDLADEGDVFDYYSEDWNDNLDATKVSPDDKSLGGFQVKKLWAVKDADSLFNSFDTDDFDAWFQSTSTDESLKILLGLESSFFFSFSSVEQDTLLSGFDSMSQLAVFSGSSF